MNKAKVSHKEEAQRALARGEWSKALESFQKHCAQEPSDLRSRQKVAEGLERLGRRLEAIHERRKVAEAYAEEG
jgi:alkyl sulfatase BDS1-like metallo-beta-lactamase superfamily hydrolase